MKCRRMKMPQRGFSLVELMVAIVIGLFLIGGAVTMLVTSKQTYVVEEDLGRIQESGRYAMKVLIDDIRLAGYFGCANAMSAVRNNLAGAINGHLFDTSNTIEGFNNATTNWLPSGAANAIATATPETDGITLRHLGGRNTPLTASMARTSDALSVTIDLNDPDQPVLGPKELAGVSNCGAADIFQITNDPSGGGATTVAHSGLTIAYENTSATGAAVVSPFVAVRYYLTTGQSGSPALFRQIFDRTTNAIVDEELIEGVDNMQITYGVDTDDNGEPDSYLSADAVPDWDNIVSVRIGLLLSSVEENSPDINNNMYNVNGELLGPFGDRRRRHVMTSTVYVRNHSSSG